MNTANLTRATFVLDRGTAQDLTYLSSRMGQSRSSLVREILSPAISELADLLRAVPDNPTPADAETFRRAGIALMGDAYAAGLTGLDANRD